MLSESRPIKMLRDDERILNNLAQGRLAFDEGITWFESLTIAEQATTLTTTLPYFILHAHPTAQDVTYALQTAPIKPTMTPVVLFRVHPFGIAMRKVTALPVAEWRKAFIVLLRLLQVADTRRRETECQQGCGHEWHNFT